MMLLCCSSEGATKSWVAGLHSAIIVKGIKDSQGVCWSLVVPHPEPVWATGHLEFPQVGCTVSSNIPPPLFPSSSSPFLTLCPPFLCVHMCVFSWVSTCMFSCVLICARAWKSGVVLVTFLCNVETSQQKVLEG